MAQEFNRIATYLAPLTKAADGACKLSDDVALIDTQSLIITTDTIVEGVHFIGDEPAALIAKKLMRCNLSDLAAKGGKPLYYTLNLTLSSIQDNAWLEAFCRGLAADQDEFSITLIGGDSTTISHGPCVLSLTAFGAPTHTPLPRRSGARVGDVVCVSGALGDAAIGLKLVQGVLQLNDKKTADYFIRRYQAPEPRLALGQELAPLMHASMDISDGLMQDVGHIANASNVGINIEAAILPLHPAVKWLLDIGGISLEDIVAGGDDYEICCTMSKENATIAATIATELGVQFTIIGKVIQGNQAVLLDEQEQPIALNVLGYVH